MVIIHQSATSTWISSTSNRPSGRIGMALGQGIILFIRNLKLVPVEWFFSIASKNLDLPLMYFDKFPESHWLLLVASTLTNRTSRVCSEKSNQIANLSKINLITNQLVVIRNETHLPAVKSQTIQLMKRKFMSCFFASLILSMIHQQIKHSTVKNQSQTPITDWLLSFSLLIGALLISVRKIEHDRSLTLFYPANNQWINSQLTTTDISNFIHQLPLDRLNSNWKSLEYQSTVIFHVALVWTSEIQLHLRFTTFISIADKDHPLLQQQPSWLPLYCEKLSDSQECHQRG